MILMNFDLENRIFNNYGGSNSKNERAFAFAEFVEKFH